MGYGTFVGDAVPHSRHGVNLPSGCAEPPTRPVERGHSAASIGHIVPPGLSLRSTTHPHASNGRAVIA